MLLSTTARGIGNAMFIGQNLAITILKIRITQVLD